MGLMDDEKSCTRQTRRRQRSRVAVQLLASARRGTRWQRPGQRVHVVRREVQPLGAGRRHDVRRVAGQEQPAVLHRLHHEAAHRRDALLERVRRFSSQPSPTRAACASSSQIRSSGHASMSSSGATCR